MVRFAMTAALLLAGCGGDDEPTPWWAVTGTATEFGDVDDDDWGDDDDDDDDDEFEEDEVLLFGELFGDEGFVGLVDAGPGGIRCEVEHELARIDPIDDCATCTFAYELELGPGDAYEDDGTCEDNGWLGLDGLVLRVGQGGGESLMALYEGDWVEVGWAEAEGEEWFFEIYLEEDIDLSQL